MDWEIRLYVCFECNTQAQAHLSKLSSDENT